jgi:hypothetical protein
MAKAIFFSGAFQFIQCDDEKKPGVMHAGLLHIGFVVGDIC